MSTCSFCGEEIKPGQKFHREMIGWAQDRKGGGVHALELRIETGALAHSYCIIKKKTEIPGQMSLLGE